MLKVWNTRSEIDIGNTIDYDVKSCQAKTAIVKYTKVCIKVLKFNRSQKKYVGMANLYVTQENKLK